MTKPRLWLIITLLLAAITGLLVYKYLSDLAKPAASGLSVTQVRAKVRIPSGTRVTADMLETEQVPKEYAHPSGVRDASMVVGQYAVVDILPGDVIVSYKTSDMPLDYKVMTIVQDVLVLAVGSDMQKKDGVQQADNVTLAVSPSEAELVALGESIGRLKLVARPSAGEPPVTLQYYDVSRMLKLFP